MEKEIINLIKKYAEKYSLKPEIVYGVVRQESGGDQFAVRFERDYRWIEDPEKHKPIICTVDTEIALQKMSFGLMQMMGGVFRELGLKGWLSKSLMNPEIQLDYGCKFLAKKIKRYGVKGGICSYNSGSPIFDRGGEYRNIYYYDQIMKYSKQFRGIYENKI